MRAGVVLLSLSSSAKVALTSPINNKSSQDGFSVRLDLHTCAANNNRSIELVIGQPLLLSNIDLTLNVPG